MHKTLHKKLTEKHFYDHAQILAFTKDDDSLPGYSYEMGILKAAAQDLLQPRPEAVANILKMARDL